MRGAGNFQLIGTASLVLCDRARLPLCPADLPRFVFEEDFAALLDHGPLAAVTPQAADAAMFLYTSGSSGRPKGCGAVAFEPLLGDRHAPAWR